MRASNFKIIICKQQNNIFIVPFKNSLFNNSYSTISNKAGLNKQPAVFLCAFSTPMLGSNFFVLLIRMYKIYLLN